MNVYNNGKLTDGALAGVYKQASSFEFPAATMTGTPFAMSRSTASSTMSYAKPPRESDTTLSSVPGSRATRSSAVKDIRERK